MHRTSLDRKNPGCPPDEVQSFHACIESATMTNVNVNSDSRNEASAFRRSAEDRHLLCASSVPVQPKCFCTDEFHPFPQLSGNIAELHAPLSTCSSLMIPHVICLTSLRTNENSFSDESLSSPPTGGCSF